MSNGRRRVLFVIQVIDKEIDTLDRFVPNFTHTPARVFLGIPDGHGDVLWV